jgi:son of sevenless-like protein
MVERIKRFLNVMKAERMDSHVQLLQSGIDKLKEGTDKRDVVASTQAPRPILPQNMTDQLTMYDYDPLELARQITIKEYNQFKIISPKECLNQAWNKSKKEEVAPNVLKMIHFSNDMSAWVMTEVLKGNTPRVRAATVQFFLRVAKHCNELNNFNGVFEIIAGLQSSAIARLKKSWEKVE